MSADLLSLIMDFVVLVALGGTIYFAMRLNNGLTNFRSSREELKTLISELSENIDQAQSSIESLRKASNTAANNLEDVLHDSKRMAEDLRMINDASNSLANRMEGLAQKNRLAAQNLTNEDFEDDEFFDEENGNDNAPIRGNIETPSFFIQDKEFDDNDTGEFSSQAEKELYEALKKNKKKRSGGA